MHTSDSLTLGPQSAIILVETSFIVSLHTHSLTLLSSACSFLHVQNTGLAGQAEISAFLGRRLTSLSLDPTKPVTCPSLYTMALKSLISSPLEAGTSILDAHHLPSSYNSVFEYTSKRLARKGLHITLTVARHEHHHASTQLTGDTIMGDKNETTASDDVLVTMTPPQTPDVVPRTPGFSTFKSLVRSKTQHHSASTEEPGFKVPKRSNTLAAPPKKPSLASLLDNGPLSPRRLRWPMTPSMPPTPRTPATPKTPATPRTPATPASIATASSTTGTTCSAGGPPETMGADFRLIHTAVLTTRADRVVRTTLDRATRKFHLSTPLVAHDPSAHGIPPDVVHRSILQNELLFSSEGLTVLSLDHLYTFKSALAQYAASMHEPGSDFRLENAVDELRRYVLSSSGGRRRLLKSALLRSYEWLGPVSDEALSGVMKMYCRAYGGAAKETGIEDDLTRDIPPTPPPKDDARLARPVTSAAPCLPASNEDSYPENWPLVHRPSSLMAGEGISDMPETPVVEQDTKVSIDNLKAGATVTENDTDKTPTKTTDKVEVQDTPITTTEAPPEIVLQHPIARSPPRTSPKAALPALKLQTSFPSLPSRRKMTPMPGASQKVRPVGTAPPSMSGTGLNGDIRIEIAADEDDGDITDFEDGDLTARPPPTATSATFWVGASIDEMLSSRRQQQQQQRLSTDTGGSWRHHRRSSSWGQSPQRLGPITPNGADDLSPITRGEWGFLMVSDPFRTKTAAVETC